MKKILLLSLAIFISACSDDDATVEAPINIGGVQAVATAIDPGFISAAHSIIGDSSQGLLALNGLSPTSSDVVVTAYGDNYYIIDRGRENITKYAFDNPGVVIYQFSTKDSITDTGTNPHAMIFVSQQKAYIIRYGSTKAWIVNPSVSAADETNFKIGELDLSSYAEVDADGIPNMDNGIVVGNKLFITLQMLNGFASTDTAYVAVFDTATDLEIDTATSGNALKGIPLLVKNPFSDIVYNDETGLVYVQAIGDFGFQYTGGIEAIDPVNYSTSILLDDGDVTTHPYGSISAFAAHTPKDAYFVGFLGFDASFNSINRLYRINLETGVIVQSSIAAFEDISIGNIKMDPLGRLWVSDTTNATLHVVNAHTDEVIDVVSTVLNPGTVAFAP